MKGYDLYKRLQALKPHQQNYAIGYFLGGVSMVAEGFNPPHEFSSASEEALSEFEDAIRQSELKEYTEEEIKRGMPNQQPEEGETTSGVFSKVVTFPKTFAEEVKEVDEMLKGKKSDLDYVDSHTGKSLRQIRAEGPAIPAPMKEVEYKEFSLGGPAKIEKTGTTAFEVRQSLATGEVKGVRQVEISIPSHLIPKSLDKKQIGGSHYQGMAIQPAEYCHQNKLQFCEASAIKYLSRFRDKGGAEDVKKALHFCCMVLEFDYGILAEVDYGSEPKIPETAKVETPESRRGHVLFKTGDLDAPNSIKDANGEVVLSLCRVCGKGERDLLNSICGMDD